MKFLTLIRRHGEKYTKTFTVDGGKKTCRKQMQFCSEHGEVDLFMSPDFEKKHASCSEINQPAAVGLELPKTFAKAA